MRYVKYAMLLGLVAIVVPASMGCQTAATYAARGGLLAGESMYFLGQDVDHHPINSSWLRPGLGQFPGQRAARYARIEMIEDRCLVDDWEHILLLDRPTYLSRIMTR